MRNNSSYMLRRIVSHKTKFSILSEFGKKIKASIEEYSSFTLQQSTYLCFFLQFVSFKQKVVIDG